MTEEIKEILNYMKQYVENKYEHDSEPMLNWKDIQCVLNYITNLQKENLVLARENEQEKQFIKDCGFENTQQLALEYISLREEKENFRKLKERYQLEKETYKSRNEKAIEWCECVVNAKYTADKLPNGKITDMGYCLDLAEPLLNILQGGDE